MQPSQPAQPDPLRTTLQADRGRLDRAVADWRGLSRAAVLRLLDQGAITLNGQVMKRSDKGTIVSAGDRLELHPRFEEGEAPKADPSLSLEYLAQGDGWLAVSKPAGVPVRPHALDETGTVLNAVVARHPEIIGVGEGGLRCGVVHRLDTDTSGTLLIATEQAAWQRLRKAFAEHRTEKRYLALVEGVPDERSDARRDLHITTHQPAKVEVFREGAGPRDSRTCSLAWQVIQRWGDRASLLEVDLHTGFLHQVRAMMNDLGHAVIGDQMYGNDDSLIPAPRQMLHAKSLRVDEVFAEASMPEDIQRVMHAL